MKISSISYLNLDEFYSMVVERSNSVNKNLHFGNKYKELLRNVSIIFNIEELTSYELIFLKMYASKILITENAKYDENFVSQNYADIYERSLKPFVNYIQLLNESSEISYDDVFCNMGLLTVSCSVTLTGEQLIPIIGFEPRDFFIIGTNKKCIKEAEDTKNNMMDPSYYHKIYSDENMKNYIISQFINSFYKFLLDKASSIEGGTSEYIHKFLYDKVPIPSNNPPLVNNACSILTVSNSFIAMDFLRDEKEDILKAFTYYRGLNISNDIIIDDTDISFVLDTPMIVFAKLFQALPNDRFVNIDNMYETMFNTLRAMEDSDYIPLIPDDTLQEKFRVRHKGRLQAVNKSILQSYTKPETMIKKLELTPGYFNIRYIIKISLRDMESLNDYLSILNEKMYGQKLTADIVRCIITNGKSVYSSLKL